MPPPDPSCWLPHAAPLAGPDLAKRLGLIWLLVALALQLLLDGEAYAHIGQGDIGGGFLAGIEHPIFGLVQLEPLTSTPEGVREDDVGAGVDELLVQRRHPLRAVDVPELGWLARRESHGEVVRAGGTVGEDDLA